MSARSTFGDGYPKLAFAALFALAAVVLAMGLVAYRKTENGEILSMPLTERATLFRQTLGTLNSTCTHASGETLVGYCREQAQFLAQFPECNHRCQQTCRQFFPRPIK